jgi:CPA2 family monovalent cation:H+ antiporter-2
VAALAALFVVLLVAFWRSARSLQGHAQAGAEVIASVIKRQLARPAGAPEDPARAKLLADVLPGLGQPQPHEITAETVGVGKTLGELNLRGLTGATILAITRDGQPILIPTGREVLKIGDVIAIAGSYEAIESAKRLLEGDAPPDSGPLANQGHGSGH